MTTAKTGAHLIDGEWVTSPTTSVSINPARPDEPVGDYSLGDASTAADAIGAATVALNGWATTSFGARAKLMEQTAVLIESRIEELATLCTLEEGKTLPESRGEVALAAETFRFHAGMAKTSTERIFPSPTPGETIRTVRSPLGVVGVITPWNFPIQIPAWKIAPALATGNTVILKPAETTPLTALAFADICQQADLPAGVVNVLTGDGSTGQLLVENPEVDKVAFTGSTEVGKAIQRAVAGTGKGLTLELGGKAANIVFDDAPIDEAVEGIVNGIFFNQGQVCCAGSRLLVQESVAETVVDSLKRRLDTLRLGDPLDKNTDIGAVNSAVHAARIQEYIKTGEDEGAQRWTASCPIPERGWWVAPTVFTDVSQTHRIAREEIFGPVLSVLTFRTPDEAVAKANNSPYGLSAGIWSEKGSRTLWMAQRLRAGVIWANTFNRFDPTSPFGGFKESGFGREGGRHGLGAYLRSEVA